MGDEDIAGVAQVGGEAVSEIGVGESAVRPGEDAEAYAAFLLTPRATASMTPVSPPQMTTAPRRASSRPTSTANAATPGVIDPPPITATYVVFASPGMGLPPWFILYFPGILQEDMIASWGFISGKASCKAEFPGVEKYFGASSGPALIGAVLTGCATAPYTGRKQVLMVSPEREQTLGYQAFSQLQKQSPRSTDQALQARVREVGESIARAADRPDFHWEFVVFQDDKVANAFCLPGKVGIYSGLFKYIRNDADLATVMSHEVGHALARHAGERLSQARLAQVGGTALERGPGGPGGGRRRG